MSDAGIDRLPFDACVSAVRFEGYAAKIVRCYKDGGEQGLADFMAYAVACAVPPEWLPGACVAAVPATDAARARRGFDHGALLASNVASYLGLPCKDLILPGAALDQRDLGRAGRFANASGRFRLAGDCTGSDVILVDDVYTTGATLSAASSCLIEGGASSVRCASFARVY